MTSQPINALFPDQRHTGETILRQAQLILLRILRIIDHICTQNDLRYWLDGGTLLGAVRHKGFIPWDDDVDIVMPRKDYEAFLYLAREILPDDLELHTVGDEPGYNCYAVPCKIRDKYSLILEAHLDSMADDKRGLFIDIIPIDKFHASGFKRKIDYSLKWLFKNLCKINDAEYPLASKVHQSAHKLLTLLGPIITPETPVKYYRKFIQRHIISKNHRVSDIELVGYGFDVYWIRLFDSRDIFPLQSIRFEGLDFSAPHNPDNVLKVFYKDYMSLPDVKDRKPKHYISLIIDTRCDPSAHHMGYR